MNNNNQIYDFEIRGKYYDFSSLKTMTMSMIMQTIAEYIIQLSINVNAYKVI